MNTLGLNKEKQILNLAKRHLESGSKEQPSSRHSGKKFITSKLAEADHSLHTVVYCEKLTARITAILEVTNICIAM